MSKAPHMIERLVPGVNRQYGEGSPALRQHLLRYRFAAAYIRPGDVVLDAACGSGYGSSLLAAAGGTIVAVDRDASAIRHGRRHYGCPSIHWIKSDLDNWTEGASVPGCGTSFFHRIVSLETLEHLRDPAAVLCAFRRHLKPEGVLIASVPIVATAHFDPFHRHDFTEQTFIALLGTTGFQVIDRLLQDDTFLTVVGRWTSGPDLEPAPVPTSDRSGRNG